MDKKFTDLLEGVLSTYKTFSFATLLAKKFTDWEAYKLGLINASGILLRRPNNTKERNALTAFDNLVRKIKMFMLRFVPDNSAFSTLVMLYLIKQESISDENKKIIEALEDEFSEFEIEFIKRQIKKH